MKIRTWDEVEVITWKNKWLKSVVLKVYKDTNKVLVKDANIVTKHIKKNWNNPWQIIKMEKAIDVSNVMLICPFTKKKTRLWSVFIEKDWITKKFRFSKIAVKEQWKDAISAIIK